MPQSGPQGQNSNQARRNACYVQVFAKVGDRLQGYGLAAGLGGAALSLVAPEALVGETAVGAGVALYSAGSALKDSVSITNFVFNNGNGSGAALSQINNFVLNNIPEGPARNVVENALDKAEEQVGLENGDASGCGKG